MEQIQQPITEKDIRVAEEVVGQYLDMLNIQATFTAENREEMIEVVLQTEESGILIGYHGETLDSLQLLLSLAVSKRIGRFVRIMIDVGDYRKNRTEYLEKLAYQFKDRALREDREQVVTSLKSWERRIIHMMLKDDEEVVSESEGTGRDRVLVIKPR